MSNGGDLLRMLMPAVSPVPTQSTRAAKPPIESLSFESLLEDARQPQALVDPKPDPTKAVDPSAATDDVNPAEKATQHDVLSQLTGIDSIQNASLRRIVAEAAGK